MTRTEFVRAYAQRSGLSDKWAILGYVDLDGKVLIALPCACDDKECEGWAMMSAEHVDHHLRTYAPDALAAAYSAAPPPEFRKGPPCRSSADFSASSMAIKARPRRSRASGRPADAATAARAYRSFDMSETDVLQDDLRDLLRALRKYDGARAQSPHEVMRECINDVERLRSALREIEQMEPASEELTLACTMAQTARAALLARDSR